MMRITLDVNGRTIGEIGVHNSGIQDADGLSRYVVYDLTEYGMGDDESVESYEDIGDVWHDRDDGAATLASLVMNEVDEDVLA